MQHQARTSELLVLSGSSDDALKALAKLYSEKLNAHEAESLHELCRSAALRGSEQDHRLAIVGDSKYSLHEKLDAFARTAGSGGPSVGASAYKNQKPVFVFGGMGAQWWGMGRELLECEPVFRMAVEQCDEYFRKLGSWRILEELCANELQSRMNVPHVGESCSFVVQVGIWEVLRSWGLEPAAIASHSLGEVAAAYAAGVLRLEDAVSVMYHRGRLLERVAGQGAMLTVWLTADEGNSLLVANAGQLSLAAINSPQTLTLAGDQGLLEQLAGKLREQSVFCSFLNTPVAYHSIYLEPLRDAVLDSLRGVHSHAPAYPFYSSVSGARAMQEELTTDHWWRNMRSTVHFGKSIDALITEGHRLFVEIGAQPVLFLAIRQCLAQRGVAGVTLPTLQRGWPEKTALLKTVGALYTLGCPIDWRQFYATLACGERENIRSDSIE
jgi:acyl transferase domain-containing protein